MHSRMIKNVMYEVVAEFEDNGQGNAIAKTIVEEGETSVNTYRLRVAANNPLTQKPFNNDLDALLEYVLDQCDETVWNAYWEDEEE